MRTLVYKRTHIGDPDERGWFGIRDCMKSVRARDFDAAIGVGGTGTEPRAQGIAEKLTWIGLGARKNSCPGRNWPVITFEHFRLFDEQGLNFRDIAPLLSIRLFSKKARVLLNFTPEEQSEIDKILKMANGFS